jgi:hypothetical protein
MSRAKADLQHSAERLLDLSIHLDTHVLFPLGTQHPSRKSADRHFPQSVILSFPYSNEQRGRTSSVLNRLDDLRNGKVVFVNIPRFLTVSVTRPKRCTAACRSSGLPTVTCSVRKNLATRKLFQAGTHLPVLQMRMGNR